MEVLIITGACGVGKTTIARKWAKLKNGSVVECDYFTEWIYQEEFPHLSQNEEKLTAPLAAVTAIEYLKYGMSVVIENVWSPLGVNLLVEKLQKLDIDVSIKVVWLFCESKENHRRDELRIPSHQMKERLDVVVSELENYSWPSFVNKLNTTNLSVEDTLLQIEEFDIV